MTLTTRLYTLLNGQLVGTDKFGNRYFRGKHTKKDGHEKRWVMFRGIAEPSKVPPEWHGWLHHTHDNPPLEHAPTKRYGWEKQHQPNLTGTKGAYVPPGHLLKGSKRAPATADYEAWEP
jgi:NADH:ubiquinone oxidoreductase subunit